MLNLFNFDAGRKCLIGEAWVPSARLDDLANALRRGNDRSGTTVPSIMQLLDTADRDALDVPVKMYTNKFTKVTHSFSFLFLFFF